MSDESLIELLESVIASKGIESGGLEDVLKTMVMVRVEAASCRRTLIALKPAVSELIVGAGTSDDGQAAVSPELTFGAKTKSSGSGGDDLSDTDRAKRRDSQQGLEAELFTGLSDHPLLSLVKKRSREVELLKEIGGASARSRLIKQREPEVVLMGLVDVLPSARKAATSKDGFDTILDASRICDERVIAVDKFLERAK